MSANPQIQPVAGPSTGIATLGVILASVGFGIVPLFARGLTEAGMAPHAVAMYRYLLASVVMAPVVWRYRHHVRVLVWGLAVGVAIGLGWVAYVRAVEVAPVSTVGVLYMTYPAFTLVFAWALFGERPSWRAVIGAGVILLAAALVTTPGAVAVEHIPALLLSLAAPAGFGFGISVLVHRMTPIPALARIGIVSAGSMLGLLPLLFSTPVSGLVPADGLGCLMVVGVGLATALVPQLLYTACSPVIGTARTAIAGSVELPVMFAIGWLAFDETLRPVQIVACAMVLGAILLTPARQPRSIAAERERR